MHTEDTRSYVDKFQDDGTHIDRTYKRTAPNTNDGLKKHVASAVAKYKVYDYAGRISLCIMMLPSVLPATLKQLKEDCYAPDWFVAQYGKSILQCIDDACEEFQEKCRHWTEFELGFPLPHVTRGGNKNLIVSMEDFYAQTACNPIVANLNGTTVLTNRSFGRMKQLLQKNTDAIARISWWHEDRFVSWDFNTDRFIDNCSYPYSPSEDARTCRDWVIQKHGL